MDNSKGKPKNTKSRPSAPDIERCALESERSPLAARKFTAHRFKLFRRERGELVRQMRTSRQLTQGDLGAPSQVRLYEKGEVAQVATMELLARLVPCPRELLKFFKVVLKHIPVACIKCRKVCNYHGKDEAVLMEELLGDITDLDL